MAQDVRSHRRRDPHGRKPPVAKLPPPKAPRARRSTAMEVFEILAEEGRGGPDGWFSVPWRDGANVVHLLAALYRELYDQECNTHAERRALAVIDSKNYVDRPAMFYEYAEGAQDDLRTCDASAGAVAMLATALRCLQLQLAKSHGGGHVFNTLLLHRWDAFGLDSLTQPIAADLVLKWRVEDAGVTGRAERAFRQAWTAKLYMAAYALAPATMPGR